MTDRFRTATHANRAARDVALIGCAAFLFAQTPDSLEAIGLSGVLADVWVGALGFGALASLIGLVTGRPRLEIYGCCFAGFAMLVWAIGAVTMPHADGVSYALACFFLAGTFGQAYRALFIAETGGRVTL